MSVEVRAQLPGARRVVVKVGSSSISGENAGKIQLIVDALAEYREDVRRGSVPEEKHTFGGLTAEDLKGLQ